jgi:hypothetical protein
MLVCVEIERTFLVDHLPESLDDHSRTPIRQGYLIATDTGLELRIRQKAERFFQAIKTVEGFSRTEIEISLLYRIHLCVLASWREIQTPPRRAR